MAKINSYTYQLMNDVEQTKKGHWRIRRDEQKDVASISHRRRYYVAEGPSPMAPASAGWGVGPVASGAGVGANPPSALTA